MAHLKTLRAALVIAACWLVSHTSAEAQTMSFSTYFDAALDSGGTTIYGYADSSDYSSGCSHGSYQTTARLISPSYRQSSSTSSGLSASTAISLNAEYGYYDIVATGTYTCSCMNFSTMSYGSGAKVGAGIMSYRLDYVHWVTSFARYKRCNPGSQCTDMDVYFGAITPPQQEWPLFIRQKVVWSTRMPQHVLAAT